MNIIQTHIVPDDVGEVRFSDFVRTVFTIIPSRKGIKKAIRRGEFLIDGEKAVSGIWVQPGQRIDLVRRHRTPKKVFDLDLNVVFEDSHLAVIEKPAGFDVSGNHFRTVRNALPGNLSESPEPDRLPAPRPVHRLDNPTRGLLLVAKTERAQMILGHQFERKEIHKRYRAVVAGSPPPEGRIETPIHGRPAVTRFRTVDQHRSLKNGWLSRMDLWPETGRTHQLRIHMARIGHPIIGDSRYGQEGTILKGRGLFLCALTLEFPHPVTHLPLCFEIPEPDMFALLVPPAERP